MGYELPLQNGSNYHIIMHAGLAQTQQTEPSDSGQCCSLE